jgi:hypothetical protein
VYLVNFIRTAHRCLETLSIAKKVDDRLVRSITPGQAGEIKDLCLSMGKI